jgi:hypothetical protein
VRIVDTTWDWFALRDPGRLRRWGSARRAIFLVFWIVLGAHFAVQLPWTWVVGAAVPFVAVIACSVAWEGGMRRYLPLLVLLALPFLVGCPKDCQTLGQLRDLACGGAPDTPGCKAARAAYDAAKCAGCSVDSAPGPICGAGDPSKLCGCWECAGRTDGIWKYTGDCPAECPEAPGSPICRTAAERDCWECRAPAWYWRDCRDVSCSEGYRCEAGHADIYTCIPLVPGPIASCVPDTTGWVHRPGPVVNLARVQAAEDAVRAARPELFVEDGHRLAKGPPGIDEFFELVAVELRRAGICAAQAHEGGELKDNVAVAVGDGAFEGWKLVEYGAARLRDLVNACKAAEDGCTWTPPAGPVSDGCGDPTPPPLFGFNVKEHRALCATIDSTPLVEGRDYCASIGFTDGRSVCAVRVEGTRDREACERRLMRGAGKPLWSSNSLTLEVFPCGAPGGCACGDFVNANPFQAAHAGHGIAKVCDGVGEVCGTLVIP